MGLYEEEKLKRLNPLIDCDILCYRCGFAKEENDDLQKCLQRVRSTINAILERFPNRQYHKLFLSGKGNFRDEIATIKPYKGNRDPTHKPPFFQEMKDYMRDVLDAVVVDGREADDAIGCWQYKHKDKSTVIVSNDKDMDNIPGYHYNWVKHRLYYLTLQKANINFFRQMLIGDPTDNIPGVPGIGPVNARRLLPYSMDVDAAEEKVRQLFKGSLGEEAYDEVYQLLWIQREEPTK